MSTTHEKTTGSKESVTGVSVFTSIVTATVVGVGVVSFWRGVWYLWDVFTLVRPEDKLLSALASTVVGIIISTVMRTFHSVLAPPMGRADIRSRQYKNQ